MTRQRSLKPSQREALASYWTQAESRRADNHDFDDLAGEIALDITAKARYDFCSSSSYHRGEAAEGD